MHNFLINEGFELINKHEDSYGLKQIFTMPYDNIPADIKNNYYYYSKCINNYIFRIYIFSIGIVLDIDLECGGNLNNSFFTFENYNFEEAYDNVINMIESKL